MEQRSAGSVGAVRAAMLGGLILVLVVAGSGLLWYQSQARGSEGGRAVTVDVKPGSSGEEIARTLRRSGVVGSDLAFRIFVRLEGAGGGLKAGEYELRRQMPFDELLAELEEGPEAEYRRLTLPEGLTVKQTAVTVGESTHIPADAFLAAATPATVRPEILPEGQQSLEGFLYPETYHVIERETAEDLVRRLVGEFDRQTAELPWDRAEALGRTPYEILVIASMVEREAQDPEEQPMVSAVVHNRLRAGMALGIDATIRYGIDKPTGPLLRSELDADGPYNTRTRPGIPPTPIANPGRGAIRAALEPAESDALYFVRLSDCRHHFFTEDYDEFLARKAEQPETC